LKLLKTDIKKFISDVHVFRKDYEANGPMVDGISPKDAVERLKRFEEEYNVKNHFF
jgi:dynein heavy chain